MTLDEQRTYWREKQRESRARRSGKEAPKADQIAEAHKPVARPYTPAPQAAITASVSCRASMEEIAALGPVRCVAFMNGVANVISVLNPQRP